MRYKIVILILTSIIFFGCANQNPVNSDTNYFVTEAFLYAGETVNEVHITNTVPVGSSDTTAPGIDNASVSLIKNGVTYNLVKNPDSSGYYLYNGNSLSINSGDNFKIEVTYNGITATGETIVPPTPQNVSLSTDTLKVLAGLSPIDIIQNGLNIDDYSDTLRWSNPDSSFYYIVIEDLEKNLETILDTSSSGGNGIFRISGRGRLQSRPVNTNYLVLNPFRFNLEYMGLHRAVVYKVNQEYENLYEQSRQLDTRDLQEPLTNIKNGFGIFTAFASDTVYFNVTR